MTPIKTKKPPAWPILAIAAVLSAILGVPVAAQQPPEAPAKAAVMPPPETFEEKLVRMLQERNMISREQAEELLRSLRSQLPGAAVAQTPASGQAATSGAAGAAAGALMAQPGDVHVHAIPEAERQKLSDEVTQRVLKTEREQNYGQPGAYPDWLKRFTFFGDFRYRQEYDQYDKKNAPFINFQAINSSGVPFDVSAGNINSPPTVNTTENRSQPRFRLRFGLTSRINDILDGTFQFNSGNNTNPVSSNQTLGTDFNKYTFVIDRAYLDLHPGSFEAWLGRMPKPWVSTTLNWYDDLSFDGVAARYRYEGADLARPFLTAGAFSVENTALDYPTNSINKLPSRDKWLWAGQLGIDLNFQDAVRSTTAVAYYYYQHVEGELSSPCLALNSSIPCDTDGTRPGFIQKGNTLFEIRDLIPDPSNPNGPQYQFFGLASPFHVLDVFTSWNFRPQGLVQVILTAEGARNLAYHQAKVASLNPVNNIDPTSPGYPNGKYHGGRNGGQLQLLVGYPSIDELWQWNTVIAYRYVQSDAVLDAFTDPDFFATNGVGGTNGKGYFVFGSLGVLHHTWLQLRFFSAEQITGPPLRVDTLQVDLNARF